MSQTVLREDLPSTAAATTPTYSTLRLSATNAQLNSVLCNLSSSYDDRRKDQLRLCFLLANSITIQHHQTEMGMMGMLDLHHRISPAHPGTIAAVELVTAGLAKLCRSSVREAVGVARQVLVVSPKRSGLFAGCSSTAYHRVRHARSIHGWRSRSSRDYVVMLRCPGQPPPRSPVYACADSPHSLAGSPDPQRLALARCPSVPRPRASLHPAGYYPCSAPPGSLLAWTL
mmetsp:Transcript_9739/g.35679  ORF Transcript_9739/g.35679 Transcript_9739/m.35679 type:complete len:229 (+) Transcript_9739:193-879(+)